MICIAPRGSAEHAQRGTRYAESKRDSLVIVPTYNEADNLERLVRAVLALHTFDVLIVDDNSPDGTGRLADALTLQHPNRVAVLHRPGKLGLGRAYIDGFRYALGHEYRRVFEMDADFSHDPASLPTLRAALDNADVVLGSRYVPGGLTSHWPAWRRALSQGGSRLLAASRASAPESSPRWTWMRFSRTATRSRSKSPTAVTGKAFAWSSSRSFSPTVD
jgi:glycosyltransferase involved in cell wall biosynthesis